MGEATDRSTRYMEVREQTLPSGLRAFSTLQKVAVGLGDYGPYEPQIAYPGVLGDDAALRKWVAEIGIGKPGAKLSLRSPTRSSPELRPSYD